MKWKPRRRLCKNAISASDLIDAFMDAHPRGADSDLVELWRHWDMVMGPEMAVLARPLGTKGEVLFVGAEDNLALQELAFLTQDILERVNTFLDSARFGSVRLSLLQGRAGLDTAAALLGEQAAQDFVPPHRPVSSPAPGPLGKLKIDRESPLGQVYWKYVSRFGIRE